MSNRSKRNMRRSSWFMTSRSRVLTIKIRHWRLRTLSSRTRYLKLRACLSRNPLRYTRYLRVRKISKMLSRHWRSRFRVNNKRSWIKMGKFKTWWRKKPWHSSKNTSSKIIIRILLVLFSILRKSIKMTTNSRMTKKFL